jgi:hypothetical protein
LQYDSGEDTVLKALRARTGWRRALALALLFAFTAGVLHMHDSGALAAEITVAATSHDDGHGHDHDDSSPSVTSHCAFCAVVGGKFYLPSYEASGVPTFSVRIAYGAPEAPPVPTSLTDLFRPPIALLG